MVELIWEARGLLRRMSGCVTEGELDASAKRLQGDTRLDTLHYIIHDFSAATEVQVSTEGVEFMAVRASVALSMNLRVRIAFVGNQPAVHALIDAFNNKGISPLRCHRFDTLEAARQFAQD